MGHPRGATEQLLARLEERLSAWPPSPAREEPGDDGLGRLQSAEAIAIREALARHLGNRTKAAGDLGISRNTLWRRMRRYGLTASRA